MNKWKKIDDPPCTPIGVFLFSGNIKEIPDENGKSHLPDPIRDFRLNLGYWDGKSFRYKDSGHRIDENYENNTDWLPTYYRILPVTPDL